MVEDPLDCFHEADCGACSMLGETYRAQLDIKRRHLEKAFARHRKLPGDLLLPTLPSPLTAGYRNRAKMAVGLSPRGNRLGYFRADSREIVDAPDCRVLIPELLETTRSLRKMLLRERSIPRDLRHVDVRCGSDPTRQHLVLVVRSKVEVALPIDVVRRACRFLDGISVNWNSGSGPQVIRGAIRPAWGEREVWVDHAGLRIRVSAGSFFQVNLGLLPEIHRLMAEFLGQGRVLADLYSGVGTHGLALRKNFDRLLFVEGVRSAVADTKATIKRGRVPGTTVVSKPVERSLERLLEAGADRVVLNPSRAGAEPEVLETLGRSAAERVAYLSCEPKTLVRDLALLVQHGFELVSVQPVDMMPQTDQVESLALLRRR